MPQIFDVIADEKARYKHNELELIINSLEILVYRSCLD